MSMQLYIEYAGNTLDFQDDGYKLLDGFHPDNPSAEIAIEGTDVNDLLDKISAINQAFEHARQHKKDADPAYLFFAPDEASTAWRTRLIDGAVSLDAGLVRRLRYNKAKTGIVFEHEPGWDGPLTELPLTNDNGEDVTGGIDIDNYDNNYVDIAGADIEGDLPAKARIEILNDYATGRHYDVWIGQDFTSPGDYAHVQAGTGEYVALTQATETEIISWTLDSAFLSATKGRDFKAMVKFYPSAPSNVWFRVKVRWNVTDLWEGEQVTVDPARLICIRDLDTFPLPPWLKGMSDLDGMELVLTGYTVDADVEVWVDYLQLTPTDGWRYLVPRGYGLPENMRIVDDGCEGILYADDGAEGDRIGFYIGYGQPIRLKQGADNRLIFLVHSATANIAQTDRSSTIQIYYRPRRSTI